jgi:hypothetical protein
MNLYRLDKQYSPISAIASLYYLFDTIGIYHCKIYKILAYSINHIGITIPDKKLKAIAKQVASPHNHEQILDEIEKQIRKYLKPLKKADPVIYKRNKKGSK